jgi:hypothetical protein
MTTRHPAPDPVELVLEFGAGNADRNCKYCEGAADAYILSSHGTDGEDVSACVCEGHVDKAVSIITRGEYDTLPSSEFGVDVREDDPGQSTLGGFGEVTA